MMPFKRQEDRNKHQAKKIQERREFLDNYKLQRGCAICGYNKHPKALCFDHIDPFTKHKDFSSKILTRWNINVLNEEIAKCRILCANCHNIETFEKEHHRLVKQSL
ncbi:MAG: hypothetical protein [Caudoviricetes sp.]|nr:MAG: hypothetical protein [Caudoviricetes sp.]